MHLHRPNFQLGQNKRNRERCILRFRKHPQRRPKNPPEKTGWSYNAALPHADRLDWRLVYDDLMGDMPRPAPLVLGHGDYRLGNMLASGDYNGLVEGCLGVEIAIRALHKQPVPKEVMARTAVVDMSNYAAYEIPAEKRPCPSLESMTAK